MKKLLQLLRRSPAVLLLTAFLFSVFSLCSCSLLGNIPGTIPVGPDFGEETTIHFETAYEEPEPEPESGENGAETEAVIEILTEAEIEEITEAKTEPVTEAKTEPVTEAKTEPVTEAKTEPVTEAKTEPVTEPEPDVPDEHGSYTTAEDVALYLHVYGHLPDNFITKKEAEALGWPGGGLEDYAPGKCIGGTYFGNFDGKLPKKKGRSYYECDIGTLGRSSRGAKRLVYSNDGLIYYTEDHYETFTQLY